MSTDTRDSLHRRLFGVPSVAQKEGDDRPAEAGETPDGEQSGTLTMNQRIRGARWPRHIPPGGTS